MTQYSILDSKCIQLIVIIFTDIFKSNNKNELNISLIIHYYSGSTYIKDETKFVPTLVTVISSLELETLLNLKRFQTIVHSINSESMINKIKLIVAKLLFTTFLLFFAINIFANQVQKINSSKFSLIFNFS
jgi:hypothetical protein